MNPLRDAEPDPRDARTPRAGEDSDPTGVRALLSALPDPGPMPAELVHRITASLAAEQARHDTAGPVPAGGLRGDRGTLHSLTDARERRAGLARRLPAIAVAASILVLAGAVVLGVLATNGGLLMTAGSDTAAESALSESGADDAGDGGGAEPFAATESEPQTEDSDQSQALDTASAPILASGVLVTSSTLVEHARTLRDGSTALGPDAAAERAMASSRIGTPDGAAACLSGLLAITPEEAAALVEAVDFVRFDGSPAALILAHSAPPGASRPEDAEVSTAYLVPLDCGPQGTVPLHDPVRIDS